jgi:hypothetical protein
VDAERGYGDPKFDIPHWHVVEGGPAAAQPGDVIAQKLPNAIDATGHVGIVIGPNTTASADSTKEPEGIITKSTFGFRSDSSTGNGMGEASKSVVRRYSDVP